MLKLQLDLCVMSALVLILLERTMSLSSSPSVTAQIDKDASRDPMNSKDNHSNDMVLVRSRPRLDKEEFGMLFGLTCPIFLRGRCPPCPDSTQDLVPGYVLKTKEGGGGKIEVVCRLVRLQDNTSRSNSLQKESTGAKGVRGVSPRVKRELERGGKVMKRKEGGPEMNKGEGEVEIELLDFSDKNARDETNHDVGLIDNDECKNSNNPVCNMAALMALFGGELGVGKSDVEKTTRSLSRRNSEQNGDGEDIDLSETIEGISGGEERSTTMEGSSLKEFPSSSLIWKASSWSPVAAISAVFLISMAAFVIVASLLIRRLDMASKKVLRSGSSSEQEPTKPKWTLLRKQSSHRVQLPSQSDLY